MDSCPLLVVKKIRGEISLGFWALLAFGRQKMPEPTRLVCGNLDVEKQTAIKV